MEVKATLRILFAAAEPREEWTHRDLAAHVYGVPPEKATPAQLAAVRRAVAALVAEGVAERRERGWVGERNPPGTHQRRVLRPVEEPIIEEYDTNHRDGIHVTRHRNRSQLWRWETEQAENPTGVLIGRATTEAEAAEREERMREVTALDRALEERARGFRD
jgi:hypothetical protein